MDFDVFRRSLRSSRSYTSLPPYPDLAIDQLNTYLSSAMDRHATMKKCIRRGGKFDTRWLSAEITQAQKDCRWLEWRLARTKSTEDRRNFKKASCRSTKRIHLHTS